MKEGACNAADDLPDKTVRSTVCAQSGGGMIVRSAQTEAALLIPCAGRRNPIGCRILGGLLRIDDAPSLRGNSSIDGFAGRRGFKVHAVVAALFPLRGVL